MKKKHAENSNSKSRSKSSVKSNPNSESQNLAVESQSQVFRTSDKIPDRDKNLMERNVSSKEEEELKNVKKLAGEAFQKKLECEQKLEQLPKQPEDCKCLSTPPAIKFLMQLLCMAWKVPPDVTFGQNHNKILDFWRPGKFYMRNLSVWLSTEWEMSPKLIKLIRDNYAKDDIFQKIELLSRNLNSIVVFLLYMATRCEIQNETRKIKLELEKAEAELKSALDRWKEIEVENSLKEAKQQA